MSDQTNQAAPRPPVAKRVPVRTQRHGRSFVDDYAWMRAENWREVMRDPSLLPQDIREHLEAENSYTNAMMANETPLIDKLFAEMKGRIKEDDSTVPSPDGTFAYYTRYRAGGNYPIFARKRWDAQKRETLGEEQILIDGDKEGEGQDYFQIGAIAHSPDHRYIAWAVDYSGSEFFEIRIRDLATGEDLGERLSDSAGGIAWAADSRTFFWTKRDEKQRPSMVYRHAIGDDASVDAKVYQEDDPGYFVSVGKTESERFITIEAHDHSTSEVYIIPAARPLDEPHLIAARKQGVEYDISDRGGQFYILTNAGDAVDFKIMTAPVTAPQPENWRPWIDERDGVLVLGQHLFADYHVRLERVDGLPRIVIRKFEDESEHDLALDEEAYSLGLGGSLEFDTHVMRFSYASPSTPDQVFDYDMSTRERRLLKTRIVPSGHKSTDYVTRRIFANAEDGARVPVTILHHKDTPIDGSAAVFLYGYGSYGITIPADFRTSRLSLVDRGFVYAIAHVRGGMSKGYRWYLDGKLEKKKNTFTDFLVAADALVEQGYAAPGRIIACGGSAGGLLVGASVNMAPQKFAGVIAAVPFVDVLNTMSDADLPLTPPEWPEWGNPIEDADAAEWISAYSPYENIRLTPYPSILATAGLSDPRVTYWEPAKWVAKLRATTTGHEPILFRINMEAGHGGASGRWDSLKETAFEFAFALKVVGLDKPANADAAPVENDEAPASADDGGAAAASDAAPSTAAADAGAPLETAQDAADEAAPTGSESSDIARSDDAQP